MLYCLNIRIQSDVRYIIIQSDDISLLLVNKTITVQVTTGFFSNAKLTVIIIIHQTHYEKSDWSRAFNQFTIACELDMINVLSAADNTFIMSSSTSAWLLSLLECSPQKQNG